MKRTKGIQSGLTAVAIALGVFSATWAADEPAERKTDQLLIQAQKICPVSGKKLGSMGEPLKAKSGEQVVFLCCKGCVGRKMDPEHWKAANANLAAAQEICPVMKKPLPKKSASVVVKGRVVFVCCPPCTKKIEADPQKYLAVVDHQLQKNVGEKNEKK